MFHVEHLPYPTPASTLVVRCWPGVCRYEPVLDKMQQISAVCGLDESDQLWLLQHVPVFTLGVNTQRAHLHSLSGRIPVVQSDRGGQVTYHGPGQMVGYLLFDIQRLGLGVKFMVAKMERAIVAFLHALGLEAAAHPQARGVYVQGQKIASLALRIRQGRCYHGFSINLQMDLTPFTEIDPCGLQLEMTQLAAWVTPLPSWQLLEQQLVRQLVAEFGYSDYRIHHAEVNHEFI